MHRLALLLLLSFPLSAQVPPAGEWFATLDVGVQQLPLELSLTQEGAAWTGALKSPAQSPTPMALETVAVAQDSLRFALPSLGMRYRGTWSADSISGIFSQGPFQAPLTFHREKPEAASQVAKERPQEPTAFPYRREEVTFAGGAEGVELAGELTLPEGSTPRAGLVLVSGSGPQDRNEDLGPAINHRPFLVLSDYLTRRGYAVLRYDDRGVAASTGDFAAATSADFADDAAAAYRFLRERLPRDTPAGLAGHSEGGMIAPLVAGQAPDIDFLILLAAPGVPIDELMAEQRRLVGQGTSPVEPVQLAITGYLKLHPGQEEQAFRRGLTDTIIATIPALPEATRSSITDPAAFAQSFVDAYGGPWMRYFFAYDPAPALRTLRMPVLAINGAKDVQVSPANLAAIADILSAAGNRDVSTHLIAGANHLLQPAGTGLPGEYGEIETTLDPAVLELIANWLDGRYR